jgi:hypothetical protein
MKNNVAKYVVARRVGTKIGSGYMHRVYISIKGVDADGKGVYVTKGNGYSPYVLTAGYWAEHYRSGLSKRDKREYNETWAAYEQLADKMTKEIEQ